MMYSRAIILYCPGAAPNIHTLMIINKRHRQYYILSFFLTVSFFIATVPTVDREAKRGTPQIINNPVHNRAAADPRSNSICNSNRNFVAYSIDAIRFF